MWRALGRLGYRPMRGGQLTLSRCAPLSLQLPLRLVEETPVGALGDELLGGLYSPPPPVCGTLHVVSSCQAGDVCLS
jgi:hypothetical protein